MALIQCSSKTKRGSHNTLHNLQQQGKQLRGEEEEEEEGGGGGERRGEEGAGEGGDTQTTHFQSSLLNTLRS